MTTIKPPDDSLSSYFDDLLGGEETLGSALDAQASSQVIATNVLVLPTKTVTKIADEKFAATAKAGNYQTPESRSVRKTLSELQPFAEPEPTQTREQKQKLEKLLQTVRTQLLIAAPVDVKTEQYLETKPHLETEPPTQVVFQADLNEIQDWVIENTTAFAEPSVTEPIVPEPIVAEPIVIEERSIAAELETYQLEGVEWLENGRPQWAQARFDVLLFQVSGLTLAVPLISLGQIQPITEELTPLFGQADWFMGFQLTPRGKISTVNTAKFVMPERYDENFVKTAKYVVSINGVPWGLAVDSVNQPISLYPEDVKWRTDRSKRPWLAGMVKEHMCALLDIPRIGQMLIDADKNFARGRH